MVSIGGEDISPNRQFGAESSPAQLQIRIGERESTPILQLVGEVDMASVPLLHEAYDGICRNSDAGLVVDLSGVTFLDSSGLAILISIHEDLEARGTALTILTPPYSVRRLFEITGLASLFQIEPPETQDPDPLG